MRTQQFLRIVEEMCLLLKLDQPAIHNVIIFYQKLSASSTHDFRNEIMIGACIFLVSKLNERIHKIRDILNVCYVVSSLYRFANKKLKNQGIQYVNLQVIKNEINDQRQELIPNFSLAKVQKFAFILNYLSLYDCPDFKYNQLKNSMWEAEQHLLRVLNYNIETTINTEYKILLSYINHFKYRIVFIITVPQGLIDLLLKIYNDTVFVEDLQKVNVPKHKGSLHFAVQLALASNVIKQDQMDKKLLQKEWWETDMQVYHDSLLDFGIVMMNYYDNL